MKFNMKIFLAVAALELVEATAEGSEETRRLQYYDRHAPDYGYDKHTGYSGPYESGYAPYDYSSGYDSYSNPYYKKGGKGKKNGGKGKKNGGKGKKGKYSYKFAPYSGQGSGYGHDGGYDYGYGYGQGSGYPHDYYNGPSYKEPYYPKKCAYSCEDKCDIDFFPFVPNPACGRVNTWGWAGSETAGGSKRPEITCLKTCPGEPGYYQPFPDAVVKADSTGGESASKLVFYHESINNVDGARGTCRPADAFPTLEIEYDFYLEKAGEFASVDIKLFVIEYGGSDRKATFIYEPQYNDNLIAQPVPANKWIHKSITADNGLWWVISSDNAFSGFPAVGVNPPNIQGDGSNTGGPLKTLNDWLTDNPLNSGAISIQNISVEASGTYAGVAYFDGVKIKYDDGTSCSLDKFFDFEQPPNSDFCPEFPPPPLEVV